MAGAVVATALGRAARGRAIMPHGDHRSRLATVPRLSAAKPIAVLRSLQWSDAAGLPFPRPEPLAQTQRPLRPSDSSAIDDSGSTSAIRTDAIEHELHAAAGFGQRAGLSGCPPTITSSSSSLC